MVCCGFIVCWTPNEITFFLNYVGYPIDFSGWFYHFICFPILVCKNVTLVK